MVSYHGERWLLLEVTGSPNQPMTACIQQATHAHDVAVKVVKYDTLRPLASMREKLMYTAEMIAKVGDFVFFVQDKNIDGKLRSLVVSGKVIETGKYTQTVHMHDTSPQHKCYLPSWEAKGKPDKSQKLQLKGYRAEAINFKHDDLELVTQLTKGMQIPRQAWLQMNDTGVVLPLEYTAKAEAMLQAENEKSARTMATTVSRATRRPIRKARLTIRTGDLKHAWVKIMLQQRGLPVKHNALLDHGRLMHHLVHGTMSAPSGAMMDQDYAHILATVGGADEGNMVSQMQSIVCCQEHPDKHSVFTSAPTYNGDATRFSAENQIYESMAHWNDGEVCEPQECHAIDEEKQDAELQEPTAPPWDDDAELVMPLLQITENMQHTQPIQCVVTPKQDAELQEPTAPPWDDDTELVMPLLQIIENMQHTQRIQCIVTPPAHTTPNAITALAMVGAVTPVFIVMTISILLTLWWLASQGIHITGFWLTLTPSERNRVLTRQTYIVL